MSEERRVLDVSDLPTASFGHRSLLWWGTLGFMAVEGSTLAVAVWSWFYLRRNFSSWPPEGIPLPDPLPGTIAMLLLLLAIPLMRKARNRAHELDARGAGRWLLATAAVTAVVAVCRALEFEAVNVRWDDNAYGSVVWLLLGLHATLVWIDVLETLAMVSVLWSSHREAKHYADVDDAALYQYFLSLAWLPVHLIIYWTPRW